MAAAVAVFAMYVPFASNCVCWAATEDAIAPAMAYYCAVCWWSEEQVGEYYGDDGVEHMYDTDGVGLICEYCVDGCRQNCSRCHWHEKEQDMVCTKELLWDESAMRAVQEQEFLCKWCCQKKHTSCKWFLENCKVLPPTLATHDWFIQGVAACLAHSVESCKKNGRKA
jgi:hypothetical protein